MKPITLIAAEVRAALDGGEVVVRRRVDEAHDKHSGVAASVHPDGSGKGWIAWWPSPVSAERTAQLYPGDEGFRCPFGEVGDLLWVREAFRFAGGFIGAMVEGEGLRPVPIYLVTSDPEEDAWEEREYEYLPADEMPQWASRLTLRLTSITVEQAPPGWIWQGLCVIDGSNEL